MDLQLNLFGIWEEAPRPPSPQPPPAPAPPPPPEPGQGELFSHVVRLRRAAEDAALALDGGALRAVFTKLGGDRGLLRGARAWPTWADALEAATGGPDALAAAALALGDSAEAARSFPQMAADLLARVRRALADRGLEALTRRDGAGATLPDGRPAAALLLEVGAVDAAIVALRGAIAEGADGAVWHATLAEALQVSGAADAALQPWCEALARDPSVRSAEALRGPASELLDLAEDEELPGDPRGWVPALAELVLGVGAGRALAGDSPAARFGRALMALRAAPRNDEAARLAAKRALVKLAPSLAPRIAPL